MSAKGSNAVVAAVIDETEQTRTGVMTVATGVCGGNPRDDSEESSLKIICKSMMATRGVHEAMGGDADCALILSNGIGRLESIHLLSAALSS